MTIAFLLDQVLPRRTCAALRQQGYTADHVADLGMATAPDVQILAYAARHGRVVDTLDADFHQHLAQSGALQPSVIRFRLEGLTGPRLAEALDDLAHRAADELQTGSAITIDELGARIRRMPFGPHRP
jgi:predicted nuclease of predicted toxin-antitoxin system